MRKLSIGIIDLVAKAPTGTMWMRIMGANFVSIMPQVVATWCEEQGHDVTLVTYTGRENLIEKLPANVDLVFISSFTEAALLSYALSNLFRSRGAITVLGGPHARCYPQDAQKYFDYVLGFTDKALVHLVLRDCSQHRPTGLRLSAERHPARLPGVARRWKFIDQSLRKAPVIKIVPLLSSLSCPYSCDFCIDANVPYQPLDVDEMKKDLRFLLSKLKHPRVAWHDPNFGVHFDRCMDAIEEVVPPGGIDFIAESTLSLLSESRVMRLQRNGFKALLPGIESWFDMGKKSSTGQKTGMDKVDKVAYHVNMILRHIPYVQTNHIFGLDGDAGISPFELTKRFLDLAPGAFPAYSMLSAFGQAAPQNLDFQKANRVLPIPFHFLSNIQMNIKPKNYSWPDFYDHLIDVTKYSYSPRLLVRRFLANGETIPRWLNIVRGLSSEQFGRIAYFKAIKRLLEIDRPFRRFFEQETSDIPPYFVEKIRRDLGQFWDWLPKGAVSHDPNAYLLSAEQNCSSCKVPRVGVA
ncbi:MAG: radical SAM protein [Candidatus Abyssobacteria bacterium SURF_17]|uniref:Radical SAM protein n=1 Tax=Candidatus Abyssobacteria bacterium SURF_17 TaxID=2093361 RepID=A0A419EYZ5_9BACT|nr:MAG: radical SAM protein [Candidatus Abyssubacteria bacterium SURF_17]